MPSSTSTRYRHVETNSGTERADAFTGKIVANCQGLLTFPERGTRREDLRPGLRLLGYRRIVTVALVIEADDVVILGVYYAGRDYEMDLREE